MGKDSEYYLNADSIIKNENFLGHFLHGFKIKII